MVHRNRCAIESRTKEDAEVEDYNAIRQRLKMAMPKPYPINSMARHDMMEEDNRLCMMKVVGYFESVLAEKQM